MAIEPEKRRSAPSITIPDPLSCEPPNPCASSSSQLPATSLLWVGGQLPRTPLSGRLVEIEHLKEGRRLPITPRLWGDEKSPDTHLSERAVERSSDSVRSQHHAKEQKEGTHLPITPRLWTEEKSPGTDLSGRGAERSIESIRNRHNAQDPAVRRIATWLKRDSLKGQDSTPLLSPIGAKHLAQDQRLHPLPKEHSSPVVRFEDNSIVRSFIEELLVMQDRTFFGIGAEAFFEEYAKIKEWESAKKEYLEKIYPLINAYIEANKEDLLGSVQKQLLGDLNRWKLVNIAIKDAVMSKEDFARSPICADEEVKESLPDDNSLFIEHLSSLMRHYSYSNCTIIKTFYLLNQGLFSLEHENYLICSLGSGERQIKIEVRVDRERTEIFGIMPLCRIMNTRATSEVDHTDYCPIGELNVSITIPRQAEIPIDNISIVRNIKVLPLAYNFTEERYYSTPIDRFGKFGGPS